MIIKVVLKLQNKKLCKKEIAHPYFYTDGASESNRKSRNEFVGTEDLTNSGYLCICQAFEFDFYH